MAQLQRVASTHAQALAAARAGRRAGRCRRRGRAWRWPWWAGRWARACSGPRCCGTWSGRWSCSARSTTWRRRRRRWGTARPRTPGCCTSPSCMQAGWPPSRPRAPVLAQVPKAVLYGFAADAVCEALAGAAWRCCASRSPTWCLRSGCATGRGHGGAVRLRQAGRHRGRPTHRAAPLGRRRTGRLRRPCRPPWPASARATWPSC